MSGLEVSSDKKAVFTIFSEEIYKMALTLGEDPSESLENYAKAAAEQLEHLLREDITAEECKDTFIFAGALMTRAMAIESAISGEIYSYTAGSVSVTEKGEDSPGKKADRLRIQAEMLMAPYIDDRYFSFQGVRG